MALEKDKILIVEDEGIVALELEERLTQLGYDVVGVAATGRGAIETARAGVPDLVLMDINLPGDLDGAEAAAAIKRECGCAIVFLTAYGGDETLARAKQVEPLAYVLKPFNERSLDVTVQLALLRHRAERDRDQARLDQSKSEARLAAILSQSHDGIISVDENEIIRVFNQGAERIFRYPAEEVLGKPLDVLIPDESAKHHHERFAQFRQASGEDRGLGMVREVVGRRKGGETFPAEITISRLNFRDELAFTACIRDIGERRRLEEQFVQAQRMQAVGRLAASVVHDFNNLLAALQSNAFLLEPEVSEGGKHQLVEIQGVVERGMALTGRLLAFCRPRAKTSRAQLFQVNVIVDNLQKLLARLLRGSVSLDLRLGEGTGSVLADRYMVEQALMNLVVNARDAMPHGGQIELRTFSAVLPNKRLGKASSLLIPGRYAVLQVQDTGHGIPAELADSVFEPFFTTKPEGAGTGLGLSTVRDIVRQSGGDVWLESGQPGHTVFTLVLPSADAEPRKAEAPRSEASEPKAQLEGKTILVVEDDTALLGILDNLLTREGWQVVTAKSGHEALKLAQSKASGADLLLSDMNLPDTGGAELATKLLESLPKLFVVFMTGFDELAQIERVPALTRVPVLKKPFDPRALLDVIGGLFRVTRAQALPVAGGPTA